MRRVRWPGRCRLGEPIPWYVVHTKPQKELMAASMLQERLGLNVYLPEVLQHYRGRRQLRPFFPRYVFVQVDFGEVAATAIDGTPGVIRLVAFGDRPQAMQTDMLAAIRERIDKYNAEGGLPQHPFHPGDKVRLTSGPLQGLEAVFQGPMKPTQRVLVLLEFLGHLHEAEVPIEQLERLGSGPQSSHQRTTRGRGRPIRRSPLVETPS